MADPLVTVARFSSRMDADLARSRLEASGIPAFLTNEYGSATTGGAVGVQVRAGDADQAVALLRATTEEAETQKAAASLAQGDVYCPICRSGSPLPLPPPLPVRVVLHVVGLVIPIPPEWLVARRVRCAVCTHEWNPGG